MNLKIKAFKVFPRKIFKWLILAALLFLGGLFCLLEPGKTSSLSVPAEEPIFSVEAAFPERGGITSWLHALGTLRPRYASGLTFQIPGVVASSRSK